MEPLLWLSIAAVAWSYVGYPLLLGILGRVRLRATTYPPIEPTVSVIIAAYNEDRAIQEKLERTLELDYPKEKLEVLVASDRSTDRTHEIVGQFAACGVELVALPRRMGKTAAQNAAAARAHGQILVFTDATTRLRSDALKTLVQGFADPRVGCIGAALEYVSEKGSAIGRGGSLYWRYERMVKQLESRVNSLIGVSGCLYAVRADLYTPIDPDLTSDFTIALLTYAKGYLTVYDQRTVTEEKTHERAEHEFEMRTRVIVQTIHALAQNARILDPFRYGLFALQLWSHKVLRYLVPEFLLTVLVLSAGLAILPGPRASLYRTMVGIQALVYLVVPAVHWLLGRRGVRVRGLHLPLYFAHANAAALWALVCYLRGERKVTWTPVR